MSTPLGSCASAPAPLSRAGAFTLLSCASLTIMVGCVIVPGLPSIAGHLGVEGLGGWLVTLPSLGVLLFGSAAGRLVDKIGAYRALALGLVLYGAIALAALVLHGKLAVFTDRVLLGGATALVMCGGTGLISQLYTGEARLSMMARQGMAIELGGVLFLAMGGWLTKFGWQGPFTLYGVAFVFLVMLGAFVRSPGRAGDDEATGEAQRQDSGAIGPVLVAALASMTVFFTAVIVLPFRLARPDIAGLSEAQIGYFLSLVSLVAVGFASQMPRLVRAVGEYRTLTTAFLAYAAAHACFVFASSLWACLAGAVLLGAGFGLSIPLVNHMMVERSPAAQRGRNLAYLSMAIFLGQFLASPLGMLPGGAVTSIATVAMIALAAALFFLLHGGRKAQPAL